MSNTTMNITPRAYMRRWVYDGEIPYRVRDERTNRLRTAFKFNLVEVSKNRVLKDDVALVALPEVEALLAALPDLMALYQLKWGNLDPDANAVFERVKVAIEQLGGAP